MKLKSKQLWKSLGAGFTSHNDFTWEKDKWYKVKGEVKACQNGFHGSKRIIDAMRFVHMEVLALVEVKGKSDKSESDKQAWQKMRIIKAWKWEKKDSVELAIFAAEQVIGIYEKQYPNDNRPRKAIEAAKAWLKNPSDKGARAAAEAARAAAEAARAAAEAAWAAEAARAAAAEAWAAAAAAARADKTLDTCEQFIQDKIKDLKPL